MEQMEQIQFCDGNLSQSNIYSKLTLIAFARGVWSFPFSIAPEKK